MSLIPFNFFSYTESTDYGPKLERTLGVKLRGKNIGEPLNNKPKK